MFIAFCCGGALAASFAIRRIACAASDGGRLRPRCIRQRGDVGGRVAQGAPSTRRASGMIERRCFLLRCMSPHLAHLRRLSQTHKVVGYWGAADALLERVPYPGAASGRIVFAQSPSRVSLPRKGCRVGLRIVLFEACSAFTLVAACTLALSPIRDTHSEGFSQFVTSVAAPVASGWSGCRVGLAPTGKRRLVTAHTQRGHWATENFRHDRDGSSRTTEATKPPQSIANCGLLSVHCEGRLVAPWCSSRRKSTKALSAGRI